MKKEQREKSQATFTTQRNIEIEKKEKSPDVEEEGEQIEIKCKPEDFAKLKSKLDLISSDYLFCEITMIPKNLIDIEPAKVEGLRKMLDALEDKDDVQNVYTNADIPDEAMEE